MKPISSFHTILSAFAICIFSQVGVFTNPLLAQDNPPAKSGTNVELNKKLAEFLTGTRWEGQFTMTGEDAPPKKEHYEIIKAEKSDDGDFWNLIVRIKYGDNDITQPLPPIEIKWAGRTPIITVDNVAVPTLGTFDARVVIRKGANGEPGKYAGTWAHGKVGGHLFGMIYKIKDEDKKKDSESKKDGESK